MLPRSSATTFRPASVSSLARMPPVQPSPTMTTSTSFSFVTMACPSAQIGDAERLVRKRLAAIGPDMIAMHRDGAGKADDRPTGLVAVAAIDRVGIDAFDHGLVQRGPEHPHRQPAVEPDLAGGQAHQHFLALRRLDAVERLIIGLAAMRVGGLDAGAIELCRCQRQLIALARRALFPGTLHVKTVSYTHLRAHE